MKKNKALIFFIIASFFAFFGHAIFPGIHLLCYSPYLAFIFITNPLLKALWHSFFCGLIIDCTQSYLPFGFSTVSYCIITLALYKQKWTIFEDKPMSLSIFSACFSALFSFLQLLLMYFIKIPVQLTFAKFLTEVVFMAGLDAIYAFVCFTSFAYLIESIQKNRFPFFLFKKL